MAKAQLPMRKSEISRNSEEMVAQSQGRKNFFKWNWRLTQSNFVADYTTSFEESLKVSQPEPQDKRGFRPGTPS